jgi:hypothetical protein
MGLFLFCLSVCVWSFSWADEQLDKADAQKVTEHVWDPAKYIDINEIQPGMEAYCLTVYKGTEVEKFEMEVLSVVRNVRPGRDAILVQGKDERFIHTGPVGGCSGSPVYIDGRLAGALAFGWRYSKDPLYGVTPIKEMLEAGRVSNSQVGKGSTDVGRFVFDFSAGLDFAKVYEQITTSRVSGRNIQEGLTYLPCPLVTSGLPAEVSEQMGDLVEPFGLMVVSGIGSSADNNKAKDVQLEPGSCLIVPLITGDIEMEIIGTVTEVEGDKVYGFGHSLIGHGAVDLPMATGEVHTVVSNVRRSFKYATAIEIVGALTVDEAAAVSGHIGTKARMLLTPRVLQLAVAGATLYLGVLPPDHMIEYQVTIGVEGAEPVTFENVSTSVGLKEMLIESITSVGILLNNPYKEVDIESVDFDISLRPKDISSRIWSVDLSDSKVKAGQQLDVTIIVETFLAEKKKYQFTLKIPDELAPGVYDLIVCGGYDYRDFLRKAAPYKFVPQNLTTLIEVMNSILTISRDKLYCLLVLPPGGVALERAELPDLPATRVLVLRDAKRALRTQPYLHWLENSLTTGTIITDKKIMRVTVEE